jgi:hypothetical protein
MKAPAPGLPPPERERRRRRRAETPGVVKKALEAIPKKARIGKIAEVTVALSREDAYVAFRRSQRALPSGQPEQGLCRTVTVRMSAPEGGFFIEATSPETQWLFLSGSKQGPPDAFGRWTWTLVPNETGVFPLAIAMSARDVDQSGYAGDAAVPVQVLRVRIRGSFLRSALALARTILVLLAGAGMAVGIYYALKMLGKLP